MFKHPVSILVSGSSQSGKSHLVFNILRNLDTMFDEIPQDIHYFDSEYQAGFEEFKNKICFHEGLPTSPPDGVISSLWVFDDLMDESSKQSIVADIFYEIFQS